MSEDTALPLPDEEALQVARLVNWYTPPAQVVANRRLFLAEIMARGTLIEMAWMQGRYSLDEQRDAYANAPPGLFLRKNWAYWGLALMGDPEAVTYPLRFPEWTDQRPGPWPG